MKVRFSFWKILTELILIIIGVLAALAVENFRESVNERKLEKQYLVSLRDAVQADTVMMKSELKRIFSKEKSAGRMIELINTNQPIDKQEFEDLVLNITMLIDPSFMTAVYEELKSTGNLKLITNSELKRSIIEYYVNLEAQTKMRDLEKSRNYSPVFLDAFDYDEWTFKKDFSQKEILAKLDQDTGKEFLQRLRKTMYSEQSSLIYVTMPRSLELLDKINLELESL